MVFEPSMASDLDLIARIRALMPTQGVVEKRMFGGTCFLLNGNLCFGASWKGLMIRVGKEGQAAAERRGAAPLTMKGRRMGGYVRLDAAALKSDAALAAWVKTGVEHVRTLPAKPVKPERRKVVRDGLPLPPPLEAARKKAAKGKRPAKRKTR